MVSSCSQACGEGETDGACPFGLLKLGETGDRKATDVHHLGMAQQSDFHTGLNWFD